MTRLWQVVLLTVGVITLLAVLGEIAYSIAATTHGSTPSRVVQVQAGPYPLRVSFYAYPAKAGYALPFAIVPLHPIAGILSYDVISRPDPQGLPATAVRANLQAEVGTANAVQGTSEVTVQGRWMLEITVTGTPGQAKASVPFVATAPPAIPNWLGWFIGGIPLVGLLVFLFFQQSYKEMLQRRAS